MSSRKQAKKVAKKMVVEKPKTAAEKLTATIAEKTRTAKAVPQQVDGKSGKPTVQSVLHRLFSQAEPPSAAAIIQEVAKATKREPLSVSTLLLYKARYNAGKLGVQKGVKPKTPCPRLCLLNKF